MHFSPSRSNRWLWNPNGIPLSSTRRRRRNEEENTINGCWPKRHSLTHTHTEGITSRWIMHYNRLPQQRTEKRRIRRRRKKFFFLPPFLFCNLIVCVVSARKEKSFPNAVATAAVRVCMCTAIARRPITSFFFGSPPSKSVRFCDRDSRTNATLNTQKV